MQVTIARQLGLDPSTVSNFFMNARRRSVDKWKDDKDMDSRHPDDYDDDFDESMESPLELTSPSGAPSSRGGQAGYQDQVSIKATSAHNAVLVTTANPAAVVQHLQQPGSEAMTPTAALDL